MFLHFYETDFVVGLNPTFTTIPWIKKMSEFDMDNPQEGDYMYNGWETEENDDGTFYLVFVFENKKYSLGNCGSLDIVQAFEENHNGPFGPDKMVYDDDGTTMMYEPQENDHSNKFKLHVVENGYNKGRFDLSDSAYDNGKISNKLCLTTSNKKQYITK